MTTKAGGPPHGLSPKEVEEARSYEKAGYYLRDKKLYFAAGGRSHRMSSDVLVLPKVLRERVLEECHDGALGGGHSGFARTYDKLRRRYFWPGMYSDVFQWVLTCLACQKRKSKRDTRVRIHGFGDIDLQHAFQLAGFDIVGPFPKTRRGNSYIVVFTDYLTRWPEAFAIPDKSAATVARIIVSEIIPRHGCPQMFLSDNAKEFRGMLMKELTRLLSIEQRFTSPYHPACNGLTERTNGTLVNLLSMMVEDNQRNWDTVLPHALFNHRACTNATYSMSPFRMLYGHEPILPFEAMIGDLKTSKLPTKWKSAAEHLQATHELIKEGHRLVQTSLQEQEQRLRTEAAREKGYARRFQPGDSVLVHYPPVRKGLSRKLKAERWLGPYTVERRIPGLDTYVLKAAHAGQVMLKYIHCSRLKLVSERQTAAPLPPNVPDLSTADKARAPVDPADAPSTSTSASSRSQCPFAKGDIVRVSVAAWVEGSTDSCDGYVVHVTKDGTVEFITPVDAAEPDVLIEQLSGFISRYKGRWVKCDSHFTKLIYSLHFSSPFFTERVGKFWHPPAQAVAVMFNDKVQVLA
eukprot:TRINITY_DN6564_c0_g2_i4.p1 TRINITY_DN6564_c0_g2~~TRINITY_DN6564_c0_g2_i4.p1  ORF type:complete len:576 (-),score=37.88 TRINITY_DN6564_c0_g2_i4:1495-3222(-)